MHAQQTWNLTFAVLPQSRSSETPHQSSVLVLPRASIIAENANTRGEYNFAQTVGLVSNCYFVRFSIREDYTTILLK